MNFEKCELPPVPPAFLLSYVHPNGLDRSTEYVESVTSTASTRSGTGMPITAFRHEMVHDTEDRMHLRGWTIDPNLLQTTICAKLFEDNQEEMTDFVSEFAAILDKLRAAFYEISTHERISETEIQSAFILFLAHMTEKVLPGGGDVVAGQGRCLSGVMQIKVEGMEESQTRIISGATDVFVCPRPPTEEDGSCFDEMCFLCELKKPFSKMKRGLMWALKDQLLCQLELFAQGNASFPLAPVRGALTDLFALSIALRIPPSSEVSHAVFYITNRTVDSTIFVQRLLLLMCNLDLQEQLDFLSKCTTTASIDVQAEEEEMPPVAEHQGDGNGGGNISTTASGSVNSNVKAAGAAGGGVGVFRELQTNATNADLRSKTRAKATHREMVISCGSAAENRAEEREMRVQSLLIWDANRRAKARGGGGGGGGLSALSADAIDNLNASYLNAANVKPIARFLREGL